MLELGTSRGTSRSTSGMGVVVGNVPWKRLHQLQEGHHSQGGKSSHTHTEDRASPTLPPHFKVSQLPHHLSASPTSHSMEADKPEPAE